MGLRIKNHNIIVFSKKILLQLKILPDVIRRQIPDNSGNNNLRRTGPLWIWTWLYRVKIMPAAPGFILSFLTGSHRAQTSDILQIPSWDLFLWLWWALIPTHTETAPKLKFFWPCLGRGSITHLFKYWNKLIFIFRENLGLLLSTCSAHPPVELKGPPIPKYANSQF